MIGFLWDLWLVRRANRRFQRTCPHPADRTGSLLIDLGMRWCNRCGKRWTA